MSKLTEYTVHFRTDIDSAVEEITARSPEEALAEARAIAADDDRRDDLFFEPYTGRFPINEIAVETPDGKQVAEWLDDDLLVRLAADDLLAALEEAVRALHTTPCFDVPSLDCDSYQVRGKRRTGHRQGQGSGASMNSPRALSGRPRGRGPTNNTPQPSIFALWASISRGIL